ncbi:MAG: hypothetical protein ACP5JB_08050 [candidate division WOR-3 bacterium]
MLKALTVALLATTVLCIGIAIAGDNSDPGYSEGLYLYTTYLGGPYHANRCSVVAYIKDITTLERASRYTVGYTGPGGLCDFPPDYWRCKFNRFGPDGAYYIPRDSRYRWRFYAKRRDELHNQWIYSEWSKEMEYSEEHPFDCDTLALNRPSPPDPIPPYYTEE